MGIFAIFDFLVAFCERMRFPRIAPGHNMFTQIDPKGNPKRASFLELYLQHMHRGSMALVRSGLTKTRLSRASVRHHHFGAANASKNPFGRILC
jgi:hypothetical protein